MEVLSPTVDSREEEAKQRGQSNDHHRHRISGQATKRTDRRGPVGENSRTLNRLISFSASLHLKQARQRGAGQEDVLNWNGG